MLDRVLLLGKVDAQMLEFEPSNLELIPLCQSQAARRHCAVPQGQMFGGGEATNRFARRPVR